MRARVRLGREVGAVVVVLSMTACGTRTGLPLGLAAEASVEEASSDAGANLVCPSARDAGAPPPCHSWQPTEPDRVLVAPDAGGEAYLTSVVPSYGGALITWFTATSAGVSGWNTLALNVDGSARSAVVEHLSFSTMGGTYTNVMALAATPACSFGGLVDDPDAGCRFLPLDGNGNETGPVVALGSGACFALGPAPEGFSLLLQAKAQTGALDLVTLHTDGSLVGRASLGVRPTAYDRLVLRDESFLLSSEKEDDAGGLVETLTPFDPSGVQGHPSPVVTTISGSVMRLVQTGAGVLGAFLASDPVSPMGLRVWIAPLGADGTPTAAPVSLAGPGDKGPIYGFSLSALPSGDALLTWNELDAQDHFDFYAMDLLPLGTPRGAPTPLGTYGGVGEVFAVASEDGQRALLTFAGVHVDGTGGVLSRPLTCSER